MADLTLNLFTTTSSVSSRSSSLSKNITASSFAYANIKLPQDFTPYIQSEK